MPASTPAQSPETALPADWQAQLDTELAEMRRATQRVNRIAHSRPAPILLDGCTCGGIGDTGSHRAGCPWSAR